MRRNHLALGIAAFCLATIPALPAAADAGPTEAVYPSGAAAPPLATFAWLASKNATKYDVEILDKNGAVLQAKSFTAAKAKCAQKKNKVCRVPFGELLDPKAASWHVCGVEGSKKGPFSELAYFIVDQDGPVWAVVNADATLARGAGVVSVSPDGTGAYAVTFVKDVRLCAYTGNVGLSGDVGSEVDGAVTVVGLNGVPNGVYVSTFNKDGDFANFGFHLVVTCTGGQLAPL